MRVCLLNDAFPPVIDGVVNVVMNYAEYMQRDFGAEVVVATPRYPGADYSSYPYRVVAYHSFNTADLTSGYRTGNPFSGKSVSKLAEFKPDIIHTHCPASATVIARLLRESTDAPVVFTYHTKYDIDIERVVKMKLAAKEGIRAMVGNIEACDEIWAVSRGAGESLKALGFKGDYRVMHNGVDFPKGEADPALVREVTGGYDLPEDIPVFLYVGRMMTYKGLPLILDALKILSDCGQDFRMVFVGKGPDEELLKEKAKSLGLMDSSDGKPDKCMFTGPVYDRERLRAWNTRADLFLFPSTFDTNGLVVREAAACGLASVLVRGSCAAEGITDGWNGFTIEENAESMAALLKEAGKDIPHLHDVGKHAMDEIYLSWESCVSDAYDRYQTILEEKKRGKFPARKPLIDYDASDLFLSLTAKGMEENAKRRRLRKELMDEFRQTAVGMMENFQEAQETAEQHLEKLAENLQRELESFLDR